MPQAVGLTAELEQALQDVEIEHVESSGGVFEITVDGKKVLSKRAEGRFPAYLEVPIPIST
ncbi:MAG: SelT/SelW/SelH family protein [bacterium]|nr:SelT/SelW/SelH family protein [bacterium]